MASNSSALISGKASAEAVPPSPGDGAVPAFSVLFPDTHRSLAIRRAPPQQPDNFVDLNLDQAVEAIAAGRAEYQLTSLFHAPLQTLDEVSYRHEVFQDLLDEGLRHSITAFSAGMRAMRHHLAQAEKLHHPYQQQR